VARASRRTHSKSTIGDVARHAGVSVMTVSRVLNGEGSVRPDTRARVLASVRELDYAPNAAARSLAKAEVVRIGVIYRNPSASYLCEFLVGLLDGGADRGVQLALVECRQEDEASVQAAIRRLVDGGVHGAVLTSTLAETELVRRQLKAEGVAAVGFAARAEGEMSCVRVDDRRAAYEMTQRLLSLGHRRIGLIKGHPHHSASAERVAGFEAAMREVPDSQGLVTQGFFTFQSGLDAATQLLESPLNPTAIFASNDDMAAAAVSVARRRGLDVPRDLTVVGFDDTSVATTLWPQLTTVRQPVSEMAAIAIDLLLQEIRGQRDGTAPDPTVRIVAHTLIERESSAPPRGAVLRRAASTVREGAEGRLRRAGAV
jgi:LacI family transcriptional regulator